MWGDGVLIRVLIDVAVIVVVIVVVIMARWGSGYLLAIGAVAGGAVVHAWSMEGTGSSTQK